jgi:hypothetical protein
MFVEENSGRNFVLPVRPAIGLAIGPLFALTCFGCTSTPPQHSSSSPDLYCSSTSQHVSNYNKPLGSIRLAASSIDRHGSAANDPEQHNHVDHLNHFDRWNVDNHLSWDKWCDYSHWNRFSFRTTSKPTARSKLELEGNQHLNLRCFCWQFGRNTRSGFLVRPPRICPPHVDRTSHVRHFPPVPSMRKSHHQVRGNLLRGNISRCSNFRLGSCGGIHVYETTLPREPLKLLRLIKATQTRIMFLFEA